MPTAFESAQLNLQLFDLRREAVLREARDWFLREFNPDSFAELITIVSGPRNAAFRMVLGYWDMAASLVTTGAIDSDSLRAAHGEIFATFSKIHPRLTELRRATGEADIGRHGGCGPGRAGRRRNAGAAARGAPWRRQSGPGNSAGNIVVGR
jgi:hypothetical protein